VGRIIAVGDRNQAIYGFRGAHSASMDEIENRFHARTLPLSVSYRCPQAVVLKAREWVERIEWAEGAEEGYVGEEGTDWRGQAALALGAAEDTLQRFEETFPLAGKHDAILTDKTGREHSLDFATSSLAMPYGMSQSKIAEKLEGISKWKELKDFHAGDAILCRLTRPLVALAFELVRSRIGCRVLGRDIGQGLVALVRRICKRYRLSDGSPLEGQEGFGESLSLYLADQRARMTAKRKYSELGRLEDQVATIQVFMDSGEVEGDARAAGRGKSRAVVVAEATVRALIAEIEGLFSDNGDKTRTVTLSTVHKAKGLEWERVFILRADWRWARQEWEFQAERNIAYVACTRARRELRYLLPGDVGLED
jgi:UvrD-like helicase C-terminal domain